MKIIVSEDDGTVLLVHTVNIAALVKEAERQHRRHGDIRAAWSMLELASDATEAVKDEIIAAMAREGRKA